jgi:hypothetical protein
MKKAEAVVAAAIIGLLVGLLLARAWPQTYTEIIMQSENGTISRCILNDRGDIQCVPTYIARGYHP